MNTILLLIASNIFMTFAWYGHLRFKDVPLWKAILVSWGIAFFEYCLMVPANRMGYMTGSILGHTTQNCTGSHYTGRVYGFCHFVFERRNKMELHGQLWAHSRCRILCLPKV
jgi:hypothetical protein